MQHDYNKHANTFTEEVWLSHIHDGQHFGLPLLMVYVAYIVLVAFTFTVSRSGLDGIRKH